MKDNRINFYTQINQALINKTPHIIESGQGAYITIQGAKKLNLCSSHYLGFAMNERIMKASQSAIAKYGIGTGYRTLAGTHILHIELEKMITDFKKTDSAIVLSGGYMANCAAIQTIISKEDIIISDELNHASIIDAIKLSQVKNKLVYKHADVKDLETKLLEASNMAKNPKSDGNLPLILIVTDGVFSMDGDLAPLPQIVSLAEKYGALVMVDDAHGEGVLGKSGRGIVDHFNLHGKIDIEVGTLSKAFSVIGGFITGKKDLIQLYKQKARQFIFSSALTIPDTAALIEGFKILNESDEPILKLWANTKFLKRGLTELGFDCGDSKSPITPVMLGDEEKTKEFSARLFEEGVFATPILFPMVGKGKARIRVIPSAAHTQKDLNLAIEAFKKVGSLLHILN